MTEGESLTEDLIVEVLLKLPVKSLVRFRCVCKSWFHLIKSSNFVSRHLEQHKNHDIIMMLPPLSLNDNDEVAISILSFESLNIIAPPDSPPHFEVPDFNMDYLAVCGPCDGLLCISGVNSPILILCNPALRNFELLPPPPLSKAIPESLAIGLGFDSLRDTYKLIVIAELYPKNAGILFEAAVYNLSSRSWRKIDLDIGERNVFLGPDLGGTLFKGSIHWIVMNSEILCFDINSEVFSHMELPCMDPSSRRSHLRLQVVNGSLALFAFRTPRHRPPRFQFVGIWLMDEYGMPKSWRKHLTIGPLQGDLEPLCLWKSEALIAKDKRNQVFSVPLATHESNGINLQAEAIMVYQESLVSIDKMSLKPVE